MLSPTPCPDPEPDPTEPAVLARTPGCRRRVSVTCHQTWHLLTAQCWPVPVAVRLSWTRREPHAVTLSFRTGTTPVVWMVGRELLTTGLLAPAGLGDITVLPDPTDPHRAEMLLSTPSGRACLRFSPAHLGAYLDRLPDPPETSPAVVSLLAAITCHDRYGDNRFGDDGFGGPV